MHAVKELIPAGKTPLVAAVRQAAEVLDYRVKPGVIVVLTDGEETCGGSPCDFGKELRTTSKQLTVHIISYRPKGFSWTGDESIGAAKCMAEQNGGLYVTADTKEDLIDALQKTLDCPMMSRLEAPLNIAAGKPQFFQKAPISSASK